MAQNDQAETAVRYRHDSFQSSLVAGFFRSRGKSSANARISQTETIAFRGRSAVGRSGQPTSDSIETAPILAAHSKNPVGGFLTPKLEDADLTSANLRHADLQRADFHNANLEDADLFGANLGQVDLTGVHLSKADLRNTDLQGIKWQEIAEIKLANVRRPFRYR
jgi:uncharacterized protein YjbI with pentapeptide repeats